MADRTPDAFVPLPPLSLSHTQPEPSAPVDEEASLLSMLPLCGLCSRGLQAPLQVRSPYSRIQLTSSWDAGS